MHELRHIAKYASAEISRVFTEGKISDISKPPNVKQGQNMRSIAVSTEIFAIIWSARQDGEENEDQILRRLLQDEKREKSLNVEREIAGMPVSANSRVTPNSKWWEVIEYSLDRIGGEGSLGEIYQSVIRVCNEIGKRMPPSLDAAIRGTLEDNSSDSERYKKVRDVFTMPRGKHAGYWALRRGK